MRSESPSSRYSRSTHNLWKDSWGPRLEYLLLNCVLTLLDIDNSTLLGIPRLLSDKAYRRRVFPFIEDAIVRQFWVSDHISAALCHPAGRGGGENSPMYGGYPAEVRRESTSGHESICGVINA